MQIPDRDDCLRLLAEMEMPAHIQDHSQAVCRVALFLTDELAAAGVDLNRALVTASALLHDITKPRSFHTGENHARTGCDYLVTLGWPEVGDIVRQHVVLDAYFADAAPNEAEVVNYADKRVLHDHIVPLADRMAYILQRYADTPNRRWLLRQVWHQTVLLEQRLFGYLTFAPLQLSGQMPVE